VRANGSPIRWTRAVGPVPAADHRGRDGHAGGWRPARRGPVGQGTPRRHRLVLAADGLRARPDGDRRKPAPDHPLYKLLHTSPGFGQTAQEFRDELTRHLCWWRNAYALIRQDDAGFPVGSLEQVHPSRVVDVKRINGRRIYWITDLPPSTEVRTYSEDEVWHIRKAPLTKDGLRGVPVWETARETLGRALGVDQFGARFFANSSHAGGVIEHPGRFKDKEEQATSCPPGARAAPAPTSTVTACCSTAPSTRRRASPMRPASSWRRRKKPSTSWPACGTCPATWSGSWTGPPSPTSNNSRSSTWSTRSARGSRPSSRPPPRDLLIGEDQDRYFVEFNVSGLLRGDIKTRWQAYALGRQWGWLSVNAIRRMENMDAIGPAGDEYLKPLNMDARRPDGRPGRRKPARSGRRPGGQRCGLTFSCASWPKRPASGCSRSTWPPPPAGRPANPVPPRRPPTRSPSCRSTACRAPTASASSAASTRPA
jgi:hypothetical protein